MAGTGGDERGRDRTGGLGDAWQWRLDTSRLMGERLLGLRQIGRDATPSAADVEELRHLITALSTVGPPPPDVERASTLIR